MVMAEGTAVLRRNRPGTKQYIQQNIRADCSNIDKILEPPEGQDEGVKALNDVPTGNLPCLLLLISLNPLPKPLWLRSFFTMI
uniref:Uncharacterized protein n=1 Tax=Spermophilus dauricus TaxID=99837 RepID=A0A8C9PFZ3_SPEDA